MLYRLIFLLLIAFSSSCSKPELEARFYSENLPSAYLDSIFLVHQGKIIGTTINKLNSDSISRYQRSVISTKKQRVYLSTDTHPMKPPILSCEFISDSVVAIAGGADQVRFVNIHTGFILNEYNGGRGPGEFHNPVDIVFDGTYVAIAEEGNMRIQVFDIHGQYIRAIPLKPAGLGRVAFGISQGNVLVIDDLDSRGPTLISTNIQTGKATSMVLPKWFDDRELQIYNSFVVRSDDRWVAIASLGAPYILVYDSQLKGIHRIVQFDIPNPDRFFKNRSELIQTENRREFNRMIFDFQIQNDMLYVNTLSSGQIIAVPLARDVPQDSWKVHWASRPQFNIMPDSSNINDYANTITPTIFFGVRNNKLIVCNIDNRIDFVDIFEYPEAY